MDYIRTKADERAVKEGCYFDPESPAKVCKFAETFCTLQDGKRKGLPVNFLDWIKRDIVNPLYGWKRKDNTRRFRRGSCWTPRKQTKTTTLAVLSLWQLLEEPAAQVYCVSSTIDTAAHLFNYAADMVESNPILNKRLWVRRNIKVIEDKKSHSILKVLSGDKVGKSGHNSSAIFFDELAEIKDPEAWYRLYDSGMAREQPVWFSISTPQYDRQSLAWDQYKKACNVRDGLDLDTDYLSVVHGVPLEVDFKNPDNWWQYIPSLGDIITKDYYLKEWEACQNNPREMARFRNLLLAQWTDSLEQWLPIEDCEACVSDLTENDLLENQLPVIIGIDGAVSGLACYTIYCDETKQALVRFFHPRETAMKSDAKLNTNFLAYSKEGHLTLTEGNLIDWKGTIKPNLLRDIARFNTVCVAFDPYSLEGRVAELTDEVSCPVIGIQPTKTELAPATQYLETLVIRKELKIEDNPLAVDCLKNAAVKSDAHDRIIMDRDRAGGRYDFAAALVLALNRALDLEVIASPYNERGIWTL